MDRLDISSAQSVCSAPHAQLEIRGAAAYRSRFSQLWTTAVTVAVVALGAPASSATLPAYTGDGGVPPFYVWGSSVAQAPGTMLRHEALPANLALEDAASSERILYISTDGVGGSLKTAVSGTVYTPKGSPPDGGWPVVAWAHGTVGIADVCAPSFRGWLRRDRAYLNSWLAAGYAVVASDYQGLGTPGVHPYMLSRPEAYGVLDAVRAARVTYGFSNRVLLVGQSQGSAAALRAAYEAPQYAPDIGVRGVVATGLVIALAKPVSGAPQVPIPAYAGGGAYDAAYSILYLLGMDQLLDPSLSIDDEVTAKGRPLIATATTACLTQLFQVATANDLDPSNAFTADRARLIPIEDAAQAFPGAMFAVPVFTGTGLADNEAGTAGQYDFISDLCAAGTDVSWHYYPGLTHNGAVNASLADSLPFAHAVIAGSAVASNCAALAPPGPLQTPTPGVPYND